jgi:hypothetical protein
LARLRTADGCMSVVEVTPDRTAIRLIDHHQPWQFLLKKYPCIEAIEGDMIERLLGCPIERSIEQHSGLRRTIYQLVSRSR